MNPEVAGPAKQKYSGPIFRNLNREQAVLFLLGHTWDGDPEAQNLLERVCPDPTAEHTEDEPQFRSQGSPLLRIPKFIVPFAPGVLTEMLPLAGIDRHSARWGWLFPHFPSLRAGVSSHAEAAEPEPFRRKG